MPPFAIIYRNVPHHLLNLAKLPIGEKFSSAASIMAGQVVDVQESVRSKLEKSNTKYKIAATRRGESKFSKETW